MSIEENKRLLTSFVKDVIDGQNLGAMDRYLSSNFFHHDLAPGEQTQNRSGLAGQRAFFSDVVFTAFGEFSTRFEDLIGEDDLVAGRWRQSSRNSGPWQGHPPTGKNVEIAGISVVRIRDGVIVEEWEARDALGLLRQLGVPVPRPVIPPVRLPNPTRPAAAPTPFLTNGPLGTSRSNPKLRLNKAQAARVYMEAWNRGDLGALSTILSDRFMLHDPTGLQAPDIAGAAALISAFRAGMPDLSVSVDLQLADGDRVVNRWTARGTHTGPLLNIAPTNRRVAVTGLSIHRFTDANLQEEWSLWEQLSLYQQISAITL